MNSSLHPDELILHEYLDNELPPPQVQELLNHLQTCADCSRNLADLRQLFLVFASAGTPALETDLAPAVLLEISVKSDTSRSTQTVHPALRFTVVIQISLAILLLTLALPTLLPQWLKYLVLPSLVSTGELIAVFVRQASIFWNSSLLQGQTWLSQDFEPAVQAWIPHIPLLTMIVILGIAAIIWLAGNNLLLHQDQQIKNRSSRS